MSNSTNSTSDGSGEIELPAYLNLPPHLSAQKYFFVCTLTVAAWDTLVLTPRTWRLLRTKEWPLLKLMYHFLRLFMPMEFSVVGVAFFDTQWTLSKCNHFFLFEPICTAVLLAVCSAVHCIRIWAIYDKKRPMMYAMGSLWAFQVVVTAICCGFYRVTPLLDGQGCIAEPKAAWVGIYWLSATILYTVTLVMAVKRSLRSLELKRISYWKLMLRDGLNLYAAVWLVNMVNMLFWFIITPTGPEDPIRTIVTSMTAVLTTSMSMRLILCVRGTLKRGGGFAVNSAARSGSNGTTHVVSQSRAAPAQTNPILSITSQGAAPVAVPLSEKNVDWADKSSVGESKHENMGIYQVESADNEVASIGSDEGVKIHIETETDFNEVPKN